MHISDVSLVTWLSQTDLLCCSVWLLGLSVVLFRLPEIRTQPNSDFYPNAVEVSLTCVFFFLSTPLSSLLVFLVVDLSNVLMAVHFALGEQDIRCTVKTMIHYNGCSTMQPGELKLHVVPV